MRSKVVLMFEDFSFRSEALQYAVELALRMGSDLVLLTLLPFEPERFGSGQNRDSYRPEPPPKEAFAPYVAAARKAGVTVEAELRVGEPSSEFMKFLAETRAIHTIVWGGEQEAIQKKTRKEKHHWLARMRDRVNLPVVVPSLKS